MVTHGPLCFLSIVLVRVHTYVEEMDEQAGVTDTYRYCVSCGYRSKAGLRLNVNNT